MELECIKNKSENIISVSRINSIHYYEFGKGFTFDGESHNYWEIVYVDSGKIEIGADQKTYTLCQGEMIFHKPNEFHTIRAKETSANVFVICFACRSKVMTFFRKKVIKIPRDLKIHIAAIISEYKKTFRPMGIEDDVFKLRDDAPIGGRQMIRTNLEQLLIMLMRSEQNIDNRIFPTKESLENHIVVGIIDEIEKNVYSRQSVDSLCIKLKYSRAYLSKIFRQASGYTINDYIIKRKIAEAKKLIKNGEMNFTQISDALCFDNPHYFSRVFKKIANMTPSEYKNSVGET